MEFYVTVCHKSQLSQNLRNYICYYYTCSYYTHVHTYVPYLAPSLAAKHVSRTVRVGLPALVYS